MKIEMRARRGTAVPPRALLEQIAAVLGYAAKAEGVPRFYSVTVGFTDDERIRAFNRKFRQLDKATDVLSFPQTAGKAEWSVASPYALPGLGKVPLGDILISLDHCEAQAKAYGHSFEREICFLTLHGFLHLLGYDHIDAAEGSLMEAKAEAMLSALGVVR